MQPHKNQPDKTLTDLNHTEIRLPANSYGFADDAPESFGGENAGGQSGHDNAATDKKSADKSTTDTPILSNYGIDLTKKAEDGVLDPVVGRECEIERISQILCRRKKNNPVLIGEPGVGKSAVVEGLAARIAKRQVPHSLLGKRVMALDMASLVAGTQYRGQFEERMRRLMQELRTHKEFILFIDEIHTIVGAGSAPGSLDAANMLKPALARGEIQCVGATTQDEYRKSIEKDGALERRFQKILVEPTTAVETLEILRNVKDRYEEHHAVRYTEEALRACVDLTARYVTHRAFPDKALDALDEAGSRIRMMGVAVPKEISELEQEIETLKFHKTEAAKNQDYELAARLRDDISTMSERLDSMNRQWMDSLKKDRTQVDAEDVAKVVSMMSGVPVTRVAQSETVRLKGMREELMKRVIAQDEAITKIVKAITRNRVGLGQKERPIGTFMFVGSTGVGKTHLVRCLAECMFGRKDALIRIDMSEYGEKYSTSRLVGAPPGYVGYEEGGQLTEKVRRHPYSVILLDEIEKAHPDVFNSLLQVMDEGRMTDGNGTTVDFRNTIIIMTSNSGSRQISEFGSGIGFRNADENTGIETERIVRKALSRQFAPEFLNRLDDIIMFHSLTSKDALRIARLETGLLASELSARGLLLEITDAAHEFLVSKGFDSKYGARSLKRAIRQYVEDPLCDLLLDHPDYRGTIRFDRNGKGDALSVEMPEA